MVPLSLRERDGVRGTRWRFCRSVLDPRDTSPHPGPLPEGEGDRLRVLPDNLHKSSSENALDMVQPMKHVQESKPVRRFSPQRLFLAAVILLGLIVAGTIAFVESGPWFIGFNGSRAYDYLKQLCALGPRRSGSPAMAAQQELLVKHFEKLGGKVELQRFTARNPLDGSAVPMANIIVRWNPEKQDRVLLCGHYDTLPFPLRDPQDPRGRFVGANDNGSGVAILMELANDMKSLDLPFGVDFVMLDGEEFIFQEDGHYFLGSEHFAREYAAGRLPGHYRCGVLLDMVGDANLQLHEESTSVSWPDVRPVVDSIWKTAARLGVREFIPRVKYGVLDDHVPLHDIGGIPICDVIDMDYPPWHTQGDTPDKCSAASLAKVGWVIREWLKEEGRRMKDAG